MRQQTFQYIAQADEMGCGVAALAMVISYHGSCPPLATLRQMTATGPAGTTAYQLLTAAKTLHFDTVALQATQTLFTQPDLPLPMIAHMRQLTGDYHYVVIYGRTASTLDIADPDPAVGQIRLGITAFARLWTGVALLFTPTSETAR